jgi:hypothetical protein
MRTGLHAADGGTVAIVGDGVGVQASGGRGQQDHQWSVRWYWGFNKLVTGLDKIPALSGLAGKAIDSLSNLGRGIDLGIGATKTAGSIGYDALHGSGEPRRRGGCNISRPRGREVGTMTSARALRAFSLEVPDGIVPIPVTELADSAQVLTATLTTRFGLAAGDTSATMLGGLFAAFGELLGQSGMELAGIGLFRSPDEPDRPASVMITGTRMASGHEAVEIAIEGLRDVHVQQGQDSVETLVHLAGGPNR